MERKGIMKYAVEVGSGGMIYIPSSATIGLGTYVTLLLWEQKFERL
jgi:hypothetical protein